MPMIYTSVLQYLVKRIICENLRIVKINNRRIYKISDYTFLRKKNDEQFHGFLSHAVLCFKI